MRSTPRPALLLPFVLLLALPLLLLADEASPPAAAEPVRFGLVPADPDEGAAFPLRTIRVRTEISAFVATSTVEHVFDNLADDPIEAVYVFPLGHDAAVDDFEIEIGGRVVRGEIQRREEARRTYEQARAAGHTAALLDQERPNVFTQRVANIEPGVPVTVRLRTVEVVPYEAGTYRWTFPLTVGPRYRADGSSAEEVVTPAAVRARPSAPSVETPVARPGTTDGPEVDIEVALDAGVPIRSIETEGPPARVTRTSDHGARLRLGDGARADQDLMLRWNVSSDRPAVALLAHRTGVDGFFTLLVQPKGSISVEEAMPKEIVFVLDTSGSMSGLPIEASKRFVRQALRTLGPRDQFNLVRFAGGAETFSPAPLAGDEGSVSRALAWIDQLEAGGGTEMLAGFRAAFARPADPGRLRTVVFLTDGYIGNEHDILGAIRPVLGSARISTIGVGTGVNHHLLDSMAELGGGEFVLVRPDVDPHRALARVREWMTKPYLTDLQIDWGALPVVDVVPETPRDLGSGQTLAVVGRALGSGRGVVTIRGRLAGTPWQQQIEVDLPDRSEAHPGLPSIWARHRIEELLRNEAGLVPDEMSDSLRVEVTALALEFRLMSPFTSFVAVEDHRVANPQGAPRTVHQPSLLPAGVSFEGIFGKEGPTGLQPPPTSLIVKDGEAAGTLTVTVYDENADPLAGALVRVSHGLGRAESATGADGTATFAGIARGAGYTVAARLSGYIPAARDDVAVRAGRITEVPLQLIPELTETIRVEADAPVVDTGSTHTSTTLSMSPPPPAPTRPAARAFKAQVSGITNQAPLTGRSSAPVQADALEEVEVVTAGAGAEYGRAQGGFARVLSAPSNEVSRIVDEVRVRELAIRVLADLADDGRLSPADGGPALAALLAVMETDGTLATDPVAQALGTWALVEAAVAMPDQTWVVQAAGRARQHLALAKADGDVVNAIRSWLAREGNVEERRASATERLGKLGASDAGQRLATSLAAGRLLAMR